MYFIITIKATQRTLKVHRIELPRMLAFYEKEGIRVSVKPA